MKKNGDKNQNKLKTVDPEKKKKVKATAFEWVMINVGVLMMAVGVFLFKGPNNFATGGVSGIAIIISKYVTPLCGFFSQSVLNFILNGLLLIVGFIFLGKGCTFKTAYCSLMYTLEMYAMEWIFGACGIEISSNHALTDQKLLEFVYAMLLTGISSAILFNCRASSGGTDIIALIIKKYGKIDIGKAMIVTDLIIAASTFAIFDVTTGLFSILGLFFKSFLVDGVIESIGKSKLVTIITSHAEVAAGFILEGMHRGYTSYKAQGGYTGEEKTIIITVCKHREAYKLKLKIKGADPTAFVILTDTNEILGKGFRSSL